MAPESNKSTEEAVPDALIAQAEAAIYGNLEDNNLSQLGRRHSRNQEGVAGSSANAPPSSSFVYILTSGLRIY